MTRAQDPNREPIPVSLLPVEDPLAAALRGALIREASEVHPGPDGLTRIRARIEDGGPGRRLAPVLLAAAAVVVAVAGVSALVTLPGSQGGPVAQPVTPPVSSTIPQDVATPPGGAGGLPIYYPGRAGQSSRLFREFHPLPPAQASEGTAERVQQAITQAISQRPADPDYLVPWPAGAAARTTFTPSLITITLNGQAAGGAAAGPGQDATAVQQLIWTATAAGAQPGVAGVPARVLIRAEGPAPTRFGSIDLTQPFARGGPPGTGDPRAAVWIDSLGQNAIVPRGSLDVEGEGVGPVPLRWSLTRDGVPAGSGSVQAAAVAGGALGSGVRGGWALRLDLPAPGRYRLTVAQDARSVTGNGTDTKDFVVR